MRKIGNIQLFAEIKRTDFGATYRGMDSVRRQMVLVKTFRRYGESHAIADAESRFEQEAAIYASIKHPNIVRLLEYGITDETKFLVLEFVDGQSLHSLLKNAHVGEAFPPEIAIAIFWSALEGIKVLHQQKVIHRDLKPENILLAHDGTVKICDFDLAASAETKQTSGVTGTPGYLAPEIILGDKITHAADIFASGVVFYEMLTGTRPFCVHSVSGEMNAIVQIAHLPPSKVNTAIPTQVDSLLDKLLAKKPADRFSSINEIIHALEKNFDLRSVKKRRELLQKYIAKPVLYQQQDFTVRDAKPGFISTQSARNRFRFAPAVLVSIAFLFLVFAWQFGKQTFEPAISQPDTPDRFSEKSNEQLRQPEQDTVTVTQKNEPVAKTETRLNHDASLPANIQGDNTSLKLLAPQPENVPVQRKFSIQTNPWAYVFIDGDSLGPTPLNKPLALLDGKYDLVLKNPQFPVLHFPLAVDSLTSENVTYSLWQHIAQLELKINPWAELYINSEKQGTITGEKTFFLLPGKYELRFVHPRLGEKSETIFLQAGENRQVPVNMF